MTDTSIALEGEDSSAGRLRLQRQVPFPSLKPLVRTARALVLAGLLQSA